MNADQMEYFTFRSGSINVKAWLECRVRIAVGQEFIAGRNLTKFHNYLGYLFYCEKKYPKAIRELNSAIELKPDNCYAFAKLSRTYAAQYLKSAKLDPKRSDYQKKAVEMFAKASSTPTPEPRRLKWLEQYLVKKGILEW